MRGWIEHIPTKGVLARESAVAHIAHVVTDVQMDALGMSHQVGVADERFLAIRLCALVWACAILVMRRHVCFPVVAALELSVADMARACRIRGGGSTALW